jgi:hypothetical protein
MHFVEAADGRDAHLKAEAVRRFGGDEGADFGVREEEPKASNDRIDRMITEKPWRLLLIPAEDGLFLLPLLYIGITSLSAAVAATLFAAMHYPLFSWKYCVPKGIAYFFVAMLILPAGIWSVVVAHLLVDTFAIGSTILMRGEGKKVWKRLLRALRTE